jgi:hypothetical protein
MRSKMINQNNRNFIYSLAFFVLANITLFWDPLDKVRNLLLSFQSIKSKLLFSDLFPAFEQITGSMIILVLILLLCSLYNSIQFIRRSSGEKLFKFSLPNGFLVLLIIASLIYIKLIVFGFLYPA